MHSKQGKSWNLEHLIPLRYYNRDTWVYRDW